MVDTLNSISNFFRKISPSVRKRDFEIILLVTSDLHGNIYPYDYILDKEEDWGLAKIATRVEHYREKYENVILLDNGDFLQGSPLNYYYNFIDKRTSYPLAEVMNSLYYTASCVGNHDIEQGPKVYNRVNNQLKFPWLSANANTRSGKSYFQPFTMREIHGIRLAILGLTTPAIPLWVNPHTYRGIRWQDMKDAAAGWIKFFKEKRKADILIGLFHAGIHTKADQPDWPKDIPEENPCMDIAEQYPEYDVIIAGHEHTLYNSHQKRQSRNVKKPLLIMTGSHGRHLGVIKLRFGWQNNKWQIVDKHAKIESMKRVKPHPEVLKQYRPYHDKIISYIGKTIGQAADNISSENARFQDNAFVDLIHKAQFDATTASISLAAVFTTKYNLEEGPIRIKDVYGIYKYENNLYVLLMSGNQIKDHLEHVAQYFNQIDPDNPLKKSLINPDFMGFDYDMAEGIRYEIDITKPVGNRIIKMFDSQSGKPFDLKRKYKVAVNSYRGIQLEKKYKCRILWKSNKEMRDILVEYIQKKKIIGNDFSENWRLAPKNLVQQILYQGKTD